jgi:tetratricopeptide (TPR) repeat protein
MSTVATFDLLAKGDELRAAGRLAEAETLYRFVASQGGANLAAAAYRLGLVAKQRGLLAEAIELFGRAALDPVGPMEASIEAGIAAMTLGRGQEALEWAQNGVDAYPQRSEPRFLLGLVLAGLGRHGEAAASFVRVLAIARPHSEASKGLIGSLRKLGRRDEALEAAHAWRAEAEHDAAANATLAYLLLERESYAEALPFAREAARLAPGDADHALLIARIRLGLGEVEGAIAEIDRARTVAPMRADALVHAGHALAIAGRLVEAEQALRRAIELEPGDATAYFELADLHAFTPGDPLIERMEEQVRTAGRAPPDAQRLHFALGKAYDDVGQYASAMHHLRIANAQSRAANRYDEAATLALLRAIADIFSQQTVAALSGAGALSGAPIFIFGMPRSGSTLIEQILSRHPAVAAGGELPFFKRAIDAVRPSVGGREFPQTVEGISPSEIGRIGETYLALLAPLAEGRARVTDKLPGNALVAGLIHLALPGARLVHARRNPADACLSCYMKSFGARLPYATDLAALGRYYSAQEALMSHWRAVLPPGAIIDVSYESLVTDGETEVRRLLEACGLEWDERCLTSHESQRPVLTASVVQVRRPVTVQRVGRWRKYGRSLAPLLSALGDLAPDA